MAGTKTFAVMVDEVELAFGQRTDIATAAGGWVNDAYMRITTADSLWGTRFHAYFPTLEIQSAATSTTDGTSYVTTPTDCLFIRHIWDSTSDVKLAKISLADYIERTGRETATAEGKPREWTRRADTTKGNDKIYVYPRPDATYALVIYYRAKPAALTGTNATVIGVEWDEPIVTLACAIGAQRLQMFDAAKIYKEEFKDIIRGIACVYYQEDHDKTDYRKVGPYIEGFGY